MDFLHWKLTLTVWFWHILTNQNPFTDFLKKISSEYVDSWPQILLFGTHHLGNSTTELILQCSPHVFTKNEFWIVNKKQLFIQCWNMSASSKKTMIGTIVLHSFSVIFLLSFLGYEYGILKGTSEPVRYGNTVFGVSSLGQSYIYQVL